MDYLLFAALVFLVLLCARNYGKYLAYLFEAPPMQLKLKGIEGLFYRAANIDPYQEMSWKEYLASLLIFNLIGLIFLFIILHFQHLLPFNPQNFPSLPIPLAFNTAISFVTNTNWQAYAGETTLSYFSDTLGLTVQNFLSASTGFCVILVLIRGLNRKETTLLGNFWVDLVRAMLYVLLPLSLLLGLLLISQGVIQNFSDYSIAKTLEGASQTIPMGPAASQVAIKQWGSNGGGFFNANSAHPFENPNLITNFFETFAILLIPAALVFTFGELSGKKKHAWLLFFVMGVLWLLGIVVSTIYQQHNNPIMQADPFLEGIETRFSIFNSVLWSTSTTATSNGSVNAMMSSLSPLTGGVALFNMMLGELIFGGVGVGLAGLLMYTLLTVFLCGLMVGRSPEYLGKKIEVKEIFWVMVALLVPAGLILLGTGFSLQSEEALTSISQAGPHGLTEVLYAFTSAAQNNGSAFSGLNANTDYYNWTLGFVMIMGRLAVVVPTLRIAGLLAEKRKTPHSTGTFSTDTLLFAVLLIGVILIVGALTFFPLLNLGPIVEHFLMLQERSF